MLKNPIYSPEKKGPEGKTEEYPQHKCLPFPTCLFALKLSFGPHGVKSIINTGIESFNSTDLLGQTWAGSLFVSVVLNHGQAQSWFQSTLFKTQVKQTPSSYYLEIYINNIVKTDWIGTPRVWASGFFFFLRHLTRCFRKSGAVCAVSDIEGEVL